MPTNFRWLWYLVGLAGMALTVVGILGILGSAADLGILIPLVVGGAIVIGYVIVLFRRSIDAALAAAPSRQAGASGTDGEATSPGAAASIRPGAPDSTAPNPLPPGAAAGKPASGPPRTSRR